MVAAQMRKPREVIYLKFRNGQMVWMSLGCPPIVVHENYFVHERKSAILPAMAA